MNSSMTSCIVHIAIICRLDDHLIQLHMTLYNDIFLWSKLFGIGDTADLLFFHYLKSVSVLILFLVLHKAEKIRSACLDAFSIKTRRHIAVRSMQVKDNCWQI